MSTKQTSWTVLVPQWEWQYEKSKKTAAKYWRWLDRTKLPKKYQEILADKKKFGTKFYCVDENGDRLLKNTKKVGTPNTWVFNGQDLYNASMHHTVRTKMAKYYHAYFEKYIEECIPKPIDIPPGKFLSVSCDVYIVARGNMPDISNMWLLEKFFEDALVGAGKIPDDSPDFVRESGRKRYHFVKDESERKLVFTIKYLD